MAGVKGRSGRKPLGCDVELRMRVLQQAWDIIAKAFNDPDVPAHEKRDMAVKLAIKTMPTEVIGELGLRPVMMGTITIEGKVSEFNIGSKPEIIDASPAEDTESPV